MGSSQINSVSTPPLQLEQWNYLHTHSHQNYGIFNTLQNIHTKEIIDQYHYIWNDSQEYNYDMEFFNWRQRTPNIVSCRYFLQHSRDELCSRRYMGCVYIEHMKMRLSQISDIPFPDNLYLLKESLEGYRRLYEMVQYFVVEENQMCIDWEGKVKIWMNGDLSINYAQGVKEMNKDERDMIAEVIEMIDRNTDHESQPSPTFQEYFNLKVIGRGVNFEMAQNLIFSYLRMHNVDLPHRFQAIFHLDQISQSNGLQNQQSVLYHQDGNNASSISHFPYNFGEDNQQQNMLAQPTLASFTTYRQLEPNILKIMQNRFRIPSQGSLNSRYPHSRNNSNLSVIKSPVNNQIKQPVNNQITSILSRSIAPPMQAYHGHLRNNINLRSDSQYFYQRPLEYRGQNNHIEQPLNNGYFPVVPPLNIPQQINQHARFQPNKEHTINGNTYQQSMPTQSKAMAFSNKLILEHPHINCDREETSSVIQYGGMQLQRDGWWGVDGVKSRQGNGDGLVIRYYSNLDRQIEIDEQIAADLLKYA